MKQNKNVQSIVDRNMVNKLSVVVMWLEEAYKITDSVIPSYKMIKIKYVNFEPIYYFLEI